MIDNLPAHKAAGVREAIEARGEATSRSVRRNSWHIPVPPWENLQPTEEVFKPRLILRPLPARARC